MTEEDFDIGWHFWRVDCSAFPYSLDYCCTHYHVNLNTFRAFTSAVAVRYCNTIDIGDAILFVKEGCGNVTCQGWWIAECQDWGASGPLRLAMLGLAQGLRAPRALRTVRNFAKFATTIFRVP